MANHYDQAGPDRSSWSLRPAAPRSKPPNCRRAPVDATAQPIRTPGRTTGQVGGAVAGQPGGFPALGHQRHCPLRHRPVRYRCRSARDPRQPGGVAAALPQRPHHDRGALRRTRHARIQSRARRPPRQCGQELSRRARHRRGADHDDQLRQGTPRRAGVGRSELGAEPPRGDRYAQLRRRGLAQANPRLGAKARTADGSSTRSGRRLCRRSLLNLCCCRASRRQSRRPGSALADPPSVLGRATAISRR